MHPIESVKVDLGSRQFKGTIPFDVPFNIEGAIGTEVQKVEVIYRIEKDKRKKWHYFPAKDSIKTIWERIGGEEFLVTVGPLHPNLDYEFQFNVYVKFGDATKIEELRKKFFEIYRDGLKPIYADGVIDASEFETFQTNYQKQIRQLLNLADRELVDKQGNEILIDFDKEPYLNITKSILKTSSAIKAADVNISTRHNNLKDLFFRKPAQEHRIAYILYKILDKPELLAPNSLKWWEAPLNPAREAHKSVKMAEVARIIADGQTRGIDLENLIKGGAKIVGNGIDPATNPDTNSIGLLTDFFHVMISKSFRYKSGQPVFSKNLADSIYTMVIEPLNYLRTDINEKMHASKILDRFLVEEFPNVLSNSFLLNTYLLKSRPTIITASENPYISLDLGISYAPALRSAFLYAGANFYFVPVNKKAPLSTFKNRDKFWKRFCLLVGITTSGVEEGNTKNLFSGGSIVLGAGWRMTDVIKLNGGYLFFKQKDENPLVNQDRKKATGFASISFDINIKSVIGKQLGELFGK